jgi:hypothetical protein
MEKCMVMAPESASAHQPQEYQAGVYSGGAEAQK